MRLYQKMIKVYSVFSGGMVKDLTDWLPEEEGLSQYAKLKEMYKNTFLDIQLQKKFEFFKEE